MAVEVERIMERMLPELEDLQTRGIFAPEEIKAMVKKRRDFEYLLRKRTASAEDYIRYIEYELNVEALRRRRKARLGLRKVSISDHSGIRLIHFIFDRALRKFRGSTAWWLQWLDFAMRTNSSRTVDRIFGRALMLHPRCEELWLQATEWHFDRMQNLAAARALLQRALRINKTSTRLWLAYFRLECLYVLKMKGRRVLLGLEVPASGLLSSAAVAAATAVMEAGEEEGDADGARGAADDADADFLDALEGDEDDEATQVLPEEASAVPAEAAVALGLAEGFDPFSAAAEGVPSDAAARALFFQGSVPRIVYDGALHAYTSAPADAKASLDPVSLRLSFLGACDEFRDPLGDALAASGDAGAALGFAPPAFPELSSYIVSTLVRDFPDDARTWDALAGRPINEACRAAAQRGLDIAAAVARRRKAAAALARSTKRAKGEGAAAAAAVTDISELADEDLFMVDGGAGAEEGEQAGSAEGASPAQAEDAEAAAAPAAAAAEAEAAEPVGPLHAIPGSALPSELAAGWVSAARGPGALSPYEAALASGAADAAALGGFSDVEAALLAAATVPTAATKPQALPPALPLERCPLWERAALPAPTAPAAAPSPAAGQKRKRGGAGVSPAAAPAPAPAAPALALGKGAPGTEATATDAQLLAWLKGSTKLALETLEAAQAAAPGVSTALTAARTLARLAGLQLAHGTAQVAWKLRMLGSLAAVCTDALKAAAAAKPAAASAGSAGSLAKAAAGDATVGLAATLVAAGGKATEEQRLGARAAAAAAALPLVGLARLGAQACLRLGNAEGALAACDALVAAAPSCAAAYLLRARVQTYVAAASSAATSAAALPPVEGRDTLKAAPPSAAQLAPALPEGAPLRQLLAGLQAVPKNDPVVGRLWQAAVEASAAAAGATAAPAASTAALVSRATLAGLPAHEDAKVRQAALIAAYAALLTAAASSAAAAAAARLVWAPVITAALGPSAPAPAYELAAAAELRLLHAGASSLSDMRRVFEAGVLAHGDGSHGLWLTYMAAERAGLKLARGGGRDAASDVYARAVRTLKGAALAAFISGAKALRV